MLRNPSLLYGCLHIVYRSPVYRSPVDRSPELQLPVSEEEVAAAAEAMSSEVFVQEKTPEPQPWVSLGSEQEIEEESVTESRPRVTHGDNT